MISEQDGKLLVKLARETIQARFSGEAVDIPDEFDEKRGVFVTLTKEGQLRGCIGYPLPIYPLKQALGKAALSAAFQDPRFDPVTEDELPLIKVEVSVLTVPALVEASPEDYPKEIKIGRDGLIIEAGYASGLLLPQVAPEHNLDAESFLGHVCLKAGLAPKCWLNSEIKLNTFQAQIFKEN